MKKNVLASAIDLGLLAVLGVLVVTWLTGGFSLALGPLMLTSSHVQRPLLLLLGLLCLRKLLKGKVWDDEFIAFKLASRRRGQGYLVFDKFLLLPIVLLLVIALGSVLAPFKRGLIGRYYDNAEWEGRWIGTTRDESLILEKMHKRFPELTINYSIKWRGVIWIAEAGTYQFSIISKDGSALWIDEQLVVDNLGEHDFQEQTGEVSLEKGFYPIRVVYQFLDGPGGPGFKIQWIRPNYKKRTLSSQVLFIEEPSGLGFLIGQLLEILLGAGKAGALMWGMGFLLIGIRKFLSMSPAVQRPVVLVCLFVSLWINYVFWSHNTTSFDSMWSLPVAMSLVREGNADLDEYLKTVRQQKYFGIQQMNGHAYSSYPIGPSLIAAPFMYALDQFLYRNGLLDLNQALREHHARRARLEVSIASILVALTAILLYLISELYFRDIKTRLLLVGVFAFCTSAWSTASRALWQHGPSMLLLTLALYFFLLAERKPQFAPWGVRFASLPLAFSFFVRPTNAVAILMFTLFVLLRHRKHFWSYCLWSLCVVIPLIWYNFDVYQSILPFYYLSSHQLHLNRDLFVGLLGQLVSPSRGLFVYSPIFLFAVYGVVRKIRVGQMALLEYCLLGIIMLHWGVSSAHPNWWGGHSYGPRYFTDIVPYFVYFLIPVFEVIPTFSRFKKAVIVGLLACSIVLSFFIHWRGATDWEVFIWNDSPISVDKQPSRVWDFRDIQFLRGL